MGPSLQSVLILGFVFVQLLGNTQAQDYSSYCEEIALRVDETRCLTRQNSERPQVCDVAQYLDNCISCELGQQSDQSIKTCVQQVPTSTGTIRASFLMCCEEPDYTGKADCCNAGKQATNCDEDAEAYGDEQRCKSTFLTCCYCSQRAALSDPLSRSCSERADFGSNLCQSAFLETCENQ
ncbi:uncharacterized protein LOC106170340 [Lingula anatina]|uniref:Uncharacterized protein LOC106170340 n=1 Tax=Lingula anatina TaxID=7574 RepID=A0A1S3J5C9_LINAN|nr:uncharacterized protein LOC106170340 [Lingula anatina]|eukprot:XP_013405637.1 uncharacterized protein LOC106170340 [Lingula anatina]